MFYWETIVPFGKTDVLQPDAQIIGLEQLRVFKSSHSRMLVFGYIPNEGHVVLKQTNSLDIKLLITPVSSISFHLQSETASVCQEKNYISYKFIWIKQKTSADEQF